MSAQGCSIPAPLGRSVGPDMRGSVLLRACVVILDPDHPALHPGPPRGDCKLAVHAIGGNSATQSVAVGSVFLASITSGVCIVMHIEARVFIYRLFLLLLIVFPPPNLAQAQDASPSAPARPSVDRPARGR